MCKDPELIRALTPRLTEYVPHEPTPKQTAFLLLDCLEAFYGGAAGGGKSDALLMAALQYVDVPGYNAILIRDTFKNLAQPGAIMDRAAEWLMPFVSRGKVKWMGEEKRYVFPNGATLGFGHMDGPRAHFNYQSAEFQFVGLDETVAIPEHQAMYMFSRLRRLQGSTVPLRFRCASNPPAREQVATGTWVKDRYVNPAGRYDAETGERRVFIPARMEDNPYLDRTEYERSLGKLDAVTRQQLKDGDWEIQARSGLMNRADFHILDKVPDNIISRVRRWDLAATEPAKPGDDPDYTSGLDMGLTACGKFVISDVIRIRENPGVVERIIVQTAQADGRDVAVRMEQEGGASGKTVIAHYAKILQGWDFRGEAARKNKLQRGTPFINEVERKNVYLVAGPWVGPFLSEMELIPNGPHDDQFDTAGGAYQDLTGGIIARIRELD